MDERLQCMPHCLDACVVHCCYQVLVQDARHNKSSQVLVEAAYQRDLTAFGLGEGVDSKGWIKFGKVRENVIIGVAEFWGARTLT